VEHATRERWFESPDAWRFLALRFAPVLAALNLAWEIAQLPGYAIWTNGSTRHIAFAVAHCTAGDVLIGLATLAIALVLTRAGPIAAWRVGAIGTVATVLAVGYTVYSEWVNVEIRGSWAYSELMLRLPVIGTGLAPLAQWIIIPGLALTIAVSWHRRTARASDDRRPG
jgi:hypothetical protein